MFFMMATISNLQRDVQITNSHEDWVLFETNNFELPDSVSSHFWRLKLKNNNTLQN